MYALETRFSYYDWKVMWFVSEDGDRDGIEWLVRLRLGVVG